MNPIDTVFETARRLQEAQTPYALVSVVRALAPASARPGDKAIVTADGELRGWVGGGCAQPAVIRTVRRALSDGQARLIRIAPTEETREQDLGDVLEFGMSCHSGGTLELFVDPVLPRARLVVIGASPVAASLVELAPRVGFLVTLVAHEADARGFPGVQQLIAGDAIDDVRPQIADGAWVVVATQGRRDLQGLRLALALAARQISFVASARKAQVLKSALIAGGAERAAVEAIIAPAGYPMPATTPEEIALSVLAAVVADRRGGTAGPTAVGSTAAAGTTAATRTTGATAAMSVESVSREVRRARDPADAPPSAPADAPASALANAPANAPSCCGGGAPHGGAH
ncbi:MAG: XdhC family protein [Lautropia sp.]